MFKKIWNFIKEKWLSSLIFVGLLIFILWNNEKSGGTLSGWIAIILLFATGIYWSKWKDLKEKYPDIAEKLKKDELKKVQKSNLQRNKWLDY